MRKIALRIKAQAALEFSAIFFFILTRTEVIAHVRRRYFQALVVLRHDLISKIHEGADLMRQAHSGIYHYGGLKQRLLVLRGEIIFFVPFEQSIQIRAALFSIGMCKQGADDTFKSIFYPLFVLIGQFLIRHENIRQRFFPERQVGYLFFGRIYAGRKFLLIFFIEVGYYLAYDLCRLVSYIAFSVNQKLA